MKLSESFCQDPKQISAHFTYHFIRKDAVDSCLVKTYQPVETVQLIVSKLSTLQDRGLLLQPS
jgi:hypothetical protein